MFVLGVDGWGLMVRINELFDIIKEFPESTPAIEDLKMCITSGRQRNHLVNVFRQAYSPS